MVFLHTHCLHTTDWKMRSNSKNWAAQVSNWSVSSHHIDRTATLNTNIHKSSPFLPDWRRWNYEEGPILLVIVSNPQRLNRLPKPHIICQKTTTIFWNSKTVKKFHSVFLWC